MKNFCSALLEFFLPAKRICPFCRQRAVTDCICSSCRGKINFLPQESTSLAVYEGLMQEVIRRFKYHGETDLAYPLAQLVREKFGELSGLIVPLPLHENKIRERGYNQTAVLAEALSEITYCRVYPALIRVKETVSQTKLNRYQRLHNVAGAFKTVLEVRGRKLVLLDDVLTTGATVNEAKRELLLSGAKEVKILTLAKGKIISD
ncbi:MAG: ComF family protein [bacterium]